VQPDAAVEVHRRVADDDQAHAVVELALPEKSRRRPTGSDRSRRVGEQVDALVPQPAGDVPRRSERMKLSVR
jgi:hypothetical protein